MIQFKKNFEAAQRHQKVVQLSLHCAVLSLNGLGLVMKNLEDELPDAGALFGREFSSKPLRRLDFFFHMLIANLGSVVLVPRRLGVPPDLYPDIDPDPA